VARKSAWRLVQIAVKSFDGSLPRIQEYSYEMANLSSSQVEQFKRDGFLLLYDVVPEDRLQILQCEFEQWKEESRNFSGPYGKTFDNRPRFDVEPGHSAERPALRRIASPVEISAAYLDFMRDNSALDALIDILPPTSGSRIPRSIPSNPAPRPGSSIARTFCSNLTATTTW